MTQAQAGTPDLRLKFSNQRPEISNLRTQKPAFCQAPWQAAEEPENLHFLRVSAPGTPKKSPKTLNPLKTATRTYVDMIQVYIYIYRNIGVYINIYYLGIYRNI